MTYQQANAALKAAGHDERVRKIGTCWYFVGGESHLWFSSSLNTYRLDGFTAADILRERDTLRGAR